MSLIVIYFTSAPMGRFVKSVTKQKFLLVSRNSSSYRDTRFFACLGYLVVAKSVIRSYRRESGISLYPIYPPFKVGIFRLETLHGAGYETFACEFIGKVAPFCHCSGSRPAPRRIANLFCSGQSWSRTNTPLWGTVLQTVKACLCLI